VIVATGKARRTLIEIGGAADPVAESPLPITGESFPAGSRTFTLENLGGLQVSDRVVITRPSTAEWIAALKIRGQPGNYAAMRIDWTPGSRNLVWDRCVTRIDATSRQTTVDAPITTALERRYGGGAVARIATASVIARIGLENLTLDSEFDAATPHDEEHAWIAVALDRVEDAWVRGVVARPCAGAEQASRINAAKSLWTIVGVGRTSSPEVWGAPKSPHWRRVRPSFRVNNS
jgi:hypothetical protein